MFEKVKAVRDAKGRRDLVPTGEPDQHFPCDDVLVAVGQENAFPWIERDCGIEFDKWDMPKVDAKTIASRPIRRCSSAATRRSARRTSSGRWRTATRPRSRSTRCCRGEDITGAPAAADRGASQKMGIHEWSYDNEIALDKRYRVPHRDKVVALRDIKAEVELGYDRRAGAEGSRALPQLRRADGVHRPALHRMRRLRRHLPDGLHHLHRERRRSRSAHAPAARRRTISPRTSMSATASRPAASWSRTRTSACIAGCAPSAAPPAPGTCRNISSK